jgi:hypothetical protein
MATFNSAEYGWADVEIFMLGRKLVGARGLKYKPSQEKDVIYAAGNEPRGIGRGNKKYEGTLTLLQSEVQALEQAAGQGNDIMDLRNINITVAYAPKDGGVISTDIIEFVEFTESEKGLMQGDKFGEIALPFIALGIKKNV